MYLRKVDNRWEYLRFRPLRLITDLVQHVVHYFTLDMATRAAFRCSSHRTSQGEMVHDFDIFSSPTFASLRFEMPQRVSQVCLYRNLIQSF